MIIVALRHSPVGGEGVVTALAKSEIHEEQGEEKSREEYKIGDVWVSHFGLVTWVSLRHSQDANCMERRLEALDTIFFS